MKRVTLPSGERVPAFGMVTWYLGEKRETRAEEIATLRAWPRPRGHLNRHSRDVWRRSGRGAYRRAEGRRDEVFLVSKVYPHNASRRGAVAACDRSLRRLSTDRIDFYLLHWRGNVPLEETMEAFMGLQQTGKIRLYGVSNFDLADMQELWSVPAGSTVATDQLLYNLTRRDIEWDLLPWPRARHVPIMAYSPLEVQRAGRPYNFLRTLRSLRPISDSESMLSQRLK